MQYWLVRGRPAENGDFSFIVRGDIGEWHTKQPPRTWSAGDRLLFWASSPRLELIALGEFLGEIDARADDGETHYEVRYLSPVIAKPIGIQELRADPMLKDAIFLKNGPATSVVRLTRAEGEHLFRVLADRNNEIRNVWREIDGSEPPVRDVDASAVEGERRLVEHFRIERDRSLVEKKRKAVAASEGRLACEVCGFDFASKYGDLGEGFCEVHHRNPLSDSDGPAVTRLEDLAIVCSNCHRILHRAGGIPVEDLRRRLLDANHRMQPKR